MIPQTLPDSKINHHNVVNEERVKREFLGKIVKDFGPSTNQSKKFVDEAFKHYKQIYENIERGPEISVGLLSEPGFGKTTVLNMILSGNPDSPMKASNRLASGETLFCTQVRYSKKLRLIKVYCSPKKYRDRIIRLSKMNEDNMMLDDVLSESNEDQLGLDIAVESPLMVSNEGSEEEDEYDEFEGMLPRKTEANPVSKCGLDQSELKTCYAELLKLQQEGMLDSEYQVSNDKDVMKIFEKERKQSKERLLMVDKFILYYNSANLKSNYGTLSMWDIPGYGEQNNREILSMLIEEVISNCNIILKSLDSARQVVGVNCVPDLWTYKAFEKSVDNPPTIVLTSKCPTNDLYDTMIGLHAEYLTTFKSNLSYFFDVDLELNDDGSVPQPNKLDVDFFGKYDFVVAIADQATNITIPHYSGSDDKTIRTRDNTRWTQFFKNLSEIIETRKTVETNILVFKGLRYALQISTLWKSQFPIKSAVNARTAIKSIIKETYFELSACVKILIESIDNTEKKCKIIQKRQSEELVETYSPSETLDNNIQSQLIEYNNWVEFTNYFHDRNRIIRYRMDTYKNQMFEFIEKKIDSLMGKQKKDLSSKEDEMNTFKEELVEIVDDIFHSMNFISPNERVEDYGNFDTFYSILNSMRDYLSNCAKELLHIRSQLESEETLKLAIQKFKLIDDMRRILKKEKTKTFNLPVLGLSSCYPTPACKSGKGSLTIPNKEYETIIELKKAKVLSTSEKFGNVTKQPKSKISLRRVEKEYFETNLTEEQSNLHQKGQLVLMEIDRNEKQVLVSYDEVLTEMKLAKFKTLLSTDALIGTKGGNKSHSRQRIAPIFITALPENFEETAPNFLERQIHDCSKKGSENYIIFIMVENAFLEKARSFLSEALTDAGNVLNYVFVSIDTDIFINIGKKKKLCMLLAEHFNLEVYHVMEDNFIHAEEYLKPIFVRHNNALARYLIFAEAIMYFELHSSYDYEQKKEIIEEFLTYVLDDEPLSRKQYIDGKISDDDQLKRFKSNEEFRRKCYEDPRLLWTIIQSTEASLTEKGKIILEKYKKLYNAKFDKRKHVGHLSLWNAKTAQSKFLTNEVDKLQKTTHFISSTRGNISTFYGPNMIGIHPVSDQVLFDGISSKEAKKDQASIKEGNNSSDKYFIRQMLFYGIGGFQIYAFKYSAGERKNANRNYPTRKLKSSTPQKSNKQQYQLPIKLKAEKLPSSSTSKSESKKEITKATSSLSSAAPEKPNKETKKVTSTPTKKNSTSSSSSSTPEKRVQSGKSGQATSSSSSTPTQQKSTSTISTPPIKMEKKLNTPQKNQAASASSSSVASSSTAPQTKLLAQPPKTSTPPIKKEKKSNTNKATSSSPSNNVNRKRKESDETIIPPKKFTKR